MTPTYISQLLPAVQSLHIGVIGDFALDMYYDLNPHTGEFSLETAKPVLHGSGVHTHPGGAGNVAYNLIDLGVQTVSVFGLVSNDLFGRELTHLLQQKRVQTESLLVAHDPWETCVYIKPHVGKTEQPRIDFGSSNHASSADVQRLFQQLAPHLSQLDALIVNQQFAHPLLTHVVIRELDALLKKHPSCHVFSDFRDPSIRLSQGTLKANVHEIAQLLQISLFDERDPNLCLRHAQQAHEFTGLPVLMTRGENGLIFTDGKTNTHIPGIYLTGEIDSVGAGDTCISTFAACISAGIAPKEALEIANLASAVTTQKLYQTGTANPSEIVAMASNCSYTYHLSLAHDRRKARYLPGSEIELVEDLPHREVPTYAVIDHDGTLSTLREGWEQVMHPFMIEAIAGPRVNSLSNEDYQRLASACTQLINDTTGMPTIVQMQGLRDRVQLEGYVSKEDILTPENYKAKFLEKLIEQVDKRLAQYQNGERSRRDFMVLGAWELLHALKQKGLSLFLASGTDEENVKIEAHALGYGSLFEQQIHGALPQGPGAKRRVLSHLVNDLGVNGNHIVVIGDGPAEMMEGRRVGAHCIGVASDEVRRYGWNPHKRTRLIKAGAHLVVPDFAQLSLLLDYLM